MAGPIPAAAFYGRRSAAAPAPAQPGRPARTLCRPPRPSLLGPPAAWQVFRQQAAALQAAAASPGLGLMVFGCEEKVPDGGGRRSYLVCHPSVFWHCDEQKSPDERCSYEVIRQGAPCKLYFDLEYDKTLNPDRDGDAMVETLIEVVTSAVGCLFAVKCSRCDIIDMCASSETKFSRHLIFCCKGLVFCDNVAVGNVVRDICDAIRAFVNRGETSDLQRLGLQRFGKDELKALMVNSKDGSSMFCDEAVYTKNRNFRTYKSSKFGKRRPLVKSAHNSFAPESRTDRKNCHGSAEEAFFLASLVSYIESVAEPLQYGAPPPREGASVCTAMSGMKRLHVPRGALTASPYPDVDAFVRELVSPGGIRCWNYFDTSELLVYDIVGFRFCRNIGRWHRSNNIIIVVSLRDACFYQKCHDPACRAFRSDSLPLPPELLAWRELADDWEPDGGGGQFPECGASDAEMLSAAALAEPATELSPVPSAQRRGTDGGADPELGRTGELSDDEFTSALAAVEPSQPDLFPDCGVEDGELAAVPTSVALSQHCRDGREPRLSPDDPAPTGDDAFPDCGMGDSEILAEVSTEPLSIQGDGPEDDQSTESMPLEGFEDEWLWDAGSDPFPDCGVADSQLPPGPCSGTRSRPQPTGTPYRDRDRLRADRGSQRGPDSADAFPDCGVGDWELLEVGGPAGAAASPRPADTADNGTEAHTAPTPGTDSDQLYHTAHSPSCNFEVWEWDQLAEADLLASDWEFTDEY
ncbi:DNA-directed primase/polymerase protein-like [Amphibalanus amphitrite]|uniref:DNA-directed primase/polymerase protein-like n=1 Tax=Amphibalanus amphitrite TaxID=1232801 RepID=UPI001C90244B|nr:DNA-directed primase/polymerase protein-like [Amphibalanus amphitrite]XP_043224192.1 DNA-directed primase/polymerase protein-like [Amphibalanus amphitrite]XP_043224193.1 DNA-directed primase/polymerase protein-like [Amphibalanus amphitrite]XP_043224194.1 DNA-directed primase/polymerase protein-like [Amphibalanus amphitrite]XP_043224195.1 DNA-directed primase/polymerase protein-like [Amphibalanus amphitrite]XP_043224197.1 DNA-directed primase/polymerase protein-like [Amphibalanus amphitrite]